MTCFQFPILCSLLAFLGGSANTNPLPGLIRDDSPQHFIQDENETPFTESRKEEFQRSVNLSHVPTQEKLKINPPQFMIDLYNRYVTDTKSMPVSDIVRSFTVEDILLSSSAENFTQSHILHFNVSVPQNEEITHAELKIYISLSESHAGHLLLYDVLDIQPTNNMKDTDAFLESKEFKSNQWVSIDVTRAVKRWVKSEKENNKLEVFLKTNSQLESLSPYNFTISSPPFLIVFSDNKYNRISEATMDMTDVILHEQESTIKTSFKNHINDYEDENEDYEKQTRKFMTGTKGRVKRNVKNNECRKTQLMVDFADIGWNSWIIAPKSYDAGQCKGECYYPLVDNWTPTNHALVQALMHKKSPQTIKKPCCVPTKLESIQLLYKKNDNKAIYDQQYKGMKVTECGCR